MAKIISGIDFPADRRNPATVLRQRTTQPPRHRELFNLPPPLPSKLTMVREVLKYSLTCVITPFRPTVHTCTQHTSRSLSWPSTITTPPIEDTDSGLNTNGGEERQGSVTEPVRTCIMCWCEGGPWNDHSMSAASNRWIVSTSLILSALYSSRTTHFPHSSGLSCCTEGIVIAVGVCIRI